LREILNAIFNLVKTSCHWRFLPKDLTPWESVYGYFRLWTNRGFNEELHTLLREHTRLSQGRNRQPTAAFIGRFCQSQTHLARRRLRRVIRVWSRTALHGVLEIVKRSDRLSKFVVLPPRWEAERTIGWLGAAAASTATTSADNKSHVPTHALSLGETLVFKQALKVVFMRFTVRATALQKNVWSRLAHF
jgi:transposase